MRPGYVLVKAENYFLRRNTMKDKKKVLVILGSPRKKGNSALLAEQIAKGARSAGAKVETVFLHDLNIAPCKSCYACQKPGSKGCSIKDDMQMLYNDMLGAHAWVVASPVYWFNMSAQTKIWMDRCFALPAHGIDPFSGKRIAIAMSYGGEDPFDSGCVNALRTFQDAFGFVGASIVGMVYGSAMGAGEIKTNKALMIKAEGLGEKLVSDKD
jgi:multimeric flavodoxin WrbA